MHQVLVTDGMDVQRVALEVLLERHFLVWRVPGGDYWSAFKDGRKFNGWTPLDVLGMVYIWDHRGEDWGARDDEPDIAWNWGLEDDDEDEA